MQLLRKVALAMLVVGGMLLAWGHIRWALSDVNAEYKLVWFLRMTIPGWSLVIMGWIGVVGYYIWKHAGSRGGGKP